MDTYVKECLSWCETARALYILAFVAPFYATLDNAWGSAMRQASRREPESERESK